MNDDKSAAAYHPGNAPVTPFQAWNEPGRAPGWHRMMQAKLRREWPVLAKALDALHPVEAPVLRRAPVNGVQSATISWAEHCEAWRGYHQRYPNNQDADRIAERGGFGLGELRTFLGREPDVSWNTPDSLDLLGERVPTRRRPPADLISRSLAALTAERARVDQALAIVAEMSGDDEYPLEAWWKERLMNALSAAPTAKENPHA